MSMMTSFILVTKYEINIVPIVFFNFFMATIKTVMVQLVLRIRKDRDRYFALSVTDSLTGHASLKETLRIGQEWLHSKYHVTVFLVDINRFKQINDTYGHLVGNQALLHVSTILRRITNARSGIVGRLGGGEFVVLIRDQTNEEATGFKELLLEDIKSKPLQLDGFEMPLSYSVGVASASETEGSQIDMRLHEADMEMYLDKYGSTAPSYSIDASPFPEEYQQLLSLLKEKDPHTYAHASQVAVYSGQLAQAIGLPKFHCQQIAICGWLHDIGKILIPSSI